MGAGAAAQGMAPAEGCDMGMARGFVTSTGEKAGGLAGGVMCWLARQNDQDAAIWASDGECPLRQLADFSVESIRTLGELSL